MIGSLDVVLDEDRHAVQRAAGTARLAFGVERCRDVERARVGFNHGPQVRTMPVQLLDPRQVALRELLRTHAPVGEGGRNIRERQFLERVGWRMGGWRMGGWR